MIKKSRNYIIVSVALIVILSFFCVKFQIFDSGDEFKNNQKDLEETVDSSKSTENQSQISISDTHNPYEGMSDIEFSYLKVDLPSPSFESWTDAFGVTKENRTRTIEQKLRFLNDLGNLIRLSLRDNSEFAPLLLGTLIELVTDDDITVSAAAAIVLYNLGGYNNIAINRFSSIVEQINIDRNSDRSFNRILSQILNEMKLSDDRRLDELLYEKWHSIADVVESHRYNPNIDLYLEHMGYEFPFSYWEKRVLESIEIDIFNVYVSKDDPRAVEVLKNIYDSNNELKKSLSASALYKLTGDSSYYKYLSEKAVDYIKSEYGPELTMKLTFHALLDVDFESTIEFLELGLKSENRVLAEAIIGAVSSFPEKISTEIIYESAIRQIEMGRLPQAELSSLIEQNSELSLQKYQSIKDLAMDENRGFGPQLFWPESSFHQLELKLKFLDRM